MKKLKDEMKFKNEQINLLEKRISDSFVASEKIDRSGVSLVYSADNIASLFHVLVVN